jgi:hypothetical protein
VPKNGHGAPAGAHCGFVGSLVDPGGEPRDDDQALGDELGCDFGGEGAAPVRGAARPDDRSARPIEKLRIPLGVDGPPACDRARLAERDVGERETEKGQSVGQHTEASWCDGGRAWRPYAS